MTNSPKNPKGSADSDRKKRKAFKQLNNGF